MKPADRAWLALAGGVLAWDIAAEEMLSQASARYARAHPILWHGTVCYVAAHLMHVIPARFDPLSRLAAAFNP